PVALEDRERAPSALLVFARFDAVRIEPRLCARDELAELIEAESHRGLGEQLLALGDPLGAGGHPAALEQVDDHRRALRTHGTRTERLAHERVLRRTLRPEQVRTRS